MQPTKEKPYYIVDEKPGKVVAYCTCGLSSNMPYCDGKHVGTSFEPIIVKPEKFRRVAICACGKTEHPPYCDGKHDC